MGESALWVLLVFGVFLQSYGDKHSLYYQYTVRSRRSVNNSYEFTAVTLLNDTQIDVYNGTDGIRAPKQDWVKEINGSDWERGTAELRNNGQYLNNLLNTQMKAFGHSEPGDHILQWRYGCRVEEQKNGYLTVLSYINEYGYEGENLVSYGWTSKQWSASVEQAKATEKKWNAEHHQSHVLQTCVDWLKIYLRNNTKIRQKSPLVYMITKRTDLDSNKLTLTCLATGFYPKAVEVSVRRYSIFLPEHLLTSSGVRPNDDGTYQLRKSLDVLENDQKVYDCHVTHSALKAEVITKTEIKQSKWISGLVIALVVISLILGVIFRQSGLIEVGICDFSCF